jgi:hypothetical protein
MTGSDRIACPECGRENPVGSLVCTGCSAILSGTPREVLLPTSGLAIASAVLAGVSLLTFGLPAPPALILGLTALVQIRMSRGRVRGAGWAWLGVLLSVAVAGLTVGEFAAREAAGNRKSQCLANVKDVAMAVQMYATDYNVLPAASAWEDTLGEYTKNPAVYTCADAPGRRSAYAYNLALARLPVPKLPDPAATLIIFESDRGWNAAGGPELLTPKPRHRTGDNIGFPDGHAKWVTRERLSAAATGGKLWEP